LYVAFRIDKKKTIIQNKIKKFAGII
jgi:hypothetical protein